MSLFVLQTANVLILKDSPVISGSIAIGPAPLSLASISFLTVRKLPTPSSKRNSQLVHPLPESIWVKSQDLPGPTRSVDLAAGRLQGSSDVPGSHLVQRGQGSILACVLTHLGTSGNTLGQKRFK